MTKQQDSPKVILSKYLNDSIRTIELTMRKAAPGDALRRSVSTPRLDGRPYGRRAATEVLLPRRLPLSSLQVAAVLQSRAGGERPRPPPPPAQVIMTQARMQQYTSSSTGGTAGARGAGSAGTGLPPRPTTVAAGGPWKQAGGQAGQQNGGHGDVYGGTGGGGGRPSSAPRAEHHHHHHHSHHKHHHHHHGHHKHSGQGQGQGHGYSAPGAMQGTLRGGARSEAQIPAVTAANAYAAGAAGAGGGGYGAYGAAAGGWKAGAGRRGFGAGAGGSDGRSTASGKRGAGSDAGTNASWWKAGVGTDVSYPLTAITDRTAGSLRPSEVARWNDRVSRLEAEIMEERERRRKFEEELRRLQAATGSVASR